MHQLHSRPIFQWAKLLCLGLMLASQVSLAQGPGGDGPGRDFRGRDRRGPGGFGGPGMFEPSLSRELRNQDFAAKLKLTEEQQQRLNEIDMQRQEFRRSFRGGPPEEFMAKFKEFEASAVSVLTAEQKSIWDARVAEIKAEQARDAQARTPEATPPPRTDTPADTGTTTPSPQRRTMTFNDEKPPEGATATASFGARASGAASSSDGGAGGETKNPVDASTKLSFNFRYAPWSDVLKLFADAAKLTLDLNDVPPGTFNYYDDKSYTITEAMDVLNGYLLPKGYILVRRDQFLVSLNIDNGINPALIPAISIDELPQRGANELIIVDVPVEGFDVEKIVAEIRELGGPWGKVAAVKATNSLNIMDTGSNIRRIVRLLRAGSKMDNPDSAFRSIALKHINAADAERTIRKLFGLNPIIQTASPQGQFGGQQGFDRGGFGPGGFRGNPGGFDRGGDPAFQQQQQRPQQPAFPQMGTQQTPSQYLGKIHVTSDTRTNHLLVTASATHVKLVEDAVKALDVPQDVPFTKSESPVTLRPYPVTGSDATQVGQTLNSLMPGIVAGIDTRSNKIYVQATADEHAEVERLMKTLAGDAGGDVSVINLLRLDPIQVTNTIRNLFSSDARAPMIEADVQGRRLLVRGTADQVTQVKVLLKALGETGPPSQDETQTEDRGPVRRVPFGAHDPLEIIRMIEQMREIRDQKPIRVIIPSQPSPIRERKVPADRRLDLDTDAPEEKVPVRTRSTSQTAPSPRQSSGAREASGSSFILRVSRSGSSRSSEADVPRQLALVGTESQDSDVQDTEPAAQVQTPAKAAGGISSPEKSGPLTISVLGNEYIIEGGTSEERDWIEDTMNNLASALPVRTRWTIFYLRSADATETAQLLERLFPQSSVTASTSSSSGMLGQFTNGLSQLGRGMMSSTGLNQTLGGANNLRIITDTRSNALFVAGPQDQIREVEQMLEILDASELPDSLRTSVPHTIPVEYADVDEVADLIESAFKDAMTPAAAQNQQAQNQQRFNPLAMLMGGGAAPASRKDPGTQLTIGVDRRTSHLIICCGESLFRQVESLVKSADERARDARQTVRIVPLATADPALVQSTLTSLMPKITISTSRSGSSRRRQRDPANPTPGTTDAATAGQPPAPPGANDALLLQRAMQQQQQGGGNGAMQGRPQNGSGQRNRGGGGAGRRNGN